MTGGSLEVAQQLHLELLLFVPLLLLPLHLAFRSSSRRRGGNGNFNDGGKQLLPPLPPRRLPIIGHLHLVGCLPHVSFRDLATKHGRNGLILLHLGTAPNLVVSSPRAAEAILRTHDHVFASRPASRICDELLYGSSDISFCPYGHHWRQNRKVVTTHIFSVNKVHSYRAARREEVRLVVAKIREAAVASTAVDMSVAMNTYANDTISRAVSGKFFRAEGWNKLFRELADTDSILFAGFNMEDYFPGLVDSLGFLCRWFRFPLGNSKAVEAHHRRWDELLETVVREHETMNNDSMHHHYDSTGGDFTDVFSRSKDMFAAGTTTSSLVLELAMAKLMRNPHCMAKLQDQVRAHTPEGQETVEEENLGCMPYLRAVVKETLRLHPPVPLLLPHLSMADCVVDDYSIPSGTRVIINAWAIARDRESWEKPEEFLPERFMDGGSAAAVDLRGSDFQLLPFGAGRRSCPGLNFGLATVEIMLANLMYCFDWQLPIGIDDVDMTEVFGLTLHPKEKLMLVPKLPCTAADLITPL